MKTRYILFAVVALMISACARNNEPSEPEGMQMTFTAYHEGPEMTRTSVQDGETQVYWEPADEIKVFFNVSGGRFVSQNTENATVATFTGTIDVVAGANEGGNANYTTWGLYPYRSDATSDGSSVTTTLPAEQTGRAGSFARNTNITVAQSSGLNLAFYNVCGGVRFSLLHEGIQRISFEGNNNETLAGKIKISFEDGIPLVTEVSEDKKVLYLTLPDNQAFQTGQWYYFEALPGTLSNGYKMVFYTMTGVDSYVSYDKVSIKRGVFGSIADVDKDLEFDENTSWERQLNKGLFSNANLNDDNCKSANNYYYPVEALWDGSGLSQIPHFFASDSTIPSPSWLTIDLGQTVRISKIETLPRIGYMVFQGSHPREFEFWGSTAPSGELSSESDNPLGFDDSWFCLGKFTQPKPSGYSSEGLVTDITMEDVDTFNSGNVFVLDPHEYPNCFDDVRFLRIVFAKTFTTFELGHDCSNKMVYLGEITPWELVKIE